MRAEFQTGWIEERLRALGKPKNGLAKVIGQSEARATGIIKGTRQIKARELPAISRYLELSVSEILKHCCGDPGYEQTTTDLAQAGEGDAPAMSGNSLQDSAQNTALLGPDDDKIGGDLRANSGSGLKPYLAHSMRS